MSSRLSRTAAISEAARSRTESVFLASFLFVVGMADAPISPATRARPSWDLEHFSPIVAIRSPIAGAGYDYSI